MPQAELARRVRHGIEPPKETSVGFGFSNVAHHLPTVSRGR